MELNFEQAEAMLEPQRRAELAKLMWDGAALPQVLTPAEKVFVFGLYTFIEYEDKDKLKAYFSP